MTTSPTCAIFLQQVFSCPYTQAPKTGWCLDLVRKPAVVGVCGCIAAERPYESSVSQLNTTECEAVWDLPTLSLSCNMADLCICVVISHSYSARCGESYLSSYWHATSIDQNEDCYSWPWYVSYLTLQIMEYTVQCAMIAEVRQWCKEVSTGCKEGSDRRSCSPKQWKRGDQVDHMTFNHLEYLQACYQIRVLRGQAKYHVKILKRIWSLKLDHKHAVAMEVLLISKYFLL